LILKWERLLVFVQFGPVLLCLNQRLEKFVVSGLLSVVVIKLELKNEICLFNFAIIF